MRQGARAKPMVLVQAKVDQAAYTALQITPPPTLTRVSEGYHLADTGASICLGGRQFMRSLGLNEEDLTPCDMTVCGADNASIKVLGAVLIEFYCKATKLKSRFRLWGKNPFMNAPSYHTLSLFFIPLSHDFALGIPSSHV